MHCLTVAYEGATPVWHRRGGGDPLPPFTTSANDGREKEEKAAQKVTQETHERLGRKYRKSERPKNEHNTS